MVSRSIKPVAIPEPDDDPVMLDTIHTPEAARVLLHLEKGGLSGGSYSKSRVFFPDVPEAVVANHDPETHSGASSGDDDENGHSDDNNQDNSDNNEVPPDKRPWTEEVGVRTFGIRNHVFCVVGAVLLGACY